MSPRGSEDFVRLLEAVAVRFYPGLYVLVDETAEDLLGKPDLRADVIAASSPGMKQTSVKAMALVQPKPMSSPALPDEWRHFLECTRKKSWQVDLFVHRRDARRVQGLVKSINPRAQAVPLP